MNYKCAFCYVDASSFYQRKEDGRILNLCTPHKLFFDVKLKQLYTEIEKKDIVNFLKMNKALE